MLYAWVFGLFFVLLIVVCVTEYVTDYLAELRMDRKTRRECLETLVAKRLDRERVSTCVCDNTITEFQEVGKP